MLTVKSNYSVAVLNPLVANTPLAPSAEAEALAYSWGGVGAESTGEFAGDVCTYHIRQH